MTTHKIANQAEFDASLAAGAPGDRYVMRGGEYRGLSTAVQRIVGGATWGARTKIEARAWKGVRERVVFVPDPERPTEPPLRLAHGLANVEFIGLAFDARQTAIHAAKVTSSTAGGAAHHVRLTDCEFTGAIHSGVLVTDTQHVELIGGSSHHNGSVVGLDHGVYVAISDSKVAGLDAYGNKAGGIKICHAVDLVERGVIEDCRAWGNGDAGRGAGILLHGIGLIARRNQAWGNVIGLHQYGASRGCIWSRNVTDGRQRYPFYVQPDSTGSVDDRNELIPA